MTFCIGISYLSLSHHETMFTKNMKFCTCLFYVYIYNLCLNSFHHYCVLVFQLAMLYFTHSIWAVKSDINFCIHCKTMTSTPELASWGTFYVLYIHINNYIYLHITHTDTLTPLIRGPLYLPKDRILSNYTHLHLNKSSLYILVNCIS